MWEFSYLLMGDYDWLDGVADDLVPRVVHSNGFGGSWEAELGNGILVDRTGRTYRPGGYVCARRIG